MLSDKYYVEHFMPKFEKILEDENDFLRDIATSDCGND